MESKPVGTSGAIGPLAAKTKELALKTNDSESREDDRQVKMHSSGYDVHLSPEARELAEARLKAEAIAKSTPAIRQDRIDAIKEQIANGAYQIDSEKVADGMLREAVRDHLAEIEVE